MKRIIQADHSALRQQARPVIQKMFGGAKLKKIVKEMTEALDATDDGVALAAPQIGVSLRLFVLSNKVAPPDQGVFANPTIIRRSRKKVLLEEGCLSLRGVFGQVKRSEKVTIQANNIAGKKFVFHGSGLLAEIFEHEIDHLDGVLFTDRATALFRSETSSSTKHNSKVISLKRSPLPKRS